MLAKEYKKSWTESAWSQQTQAICVPLMEKLLGEATKAEGPQHALTSTAIGAGLYRC